jgi:acyl carrier protein
VSDDRKVPAGGELPAIIGFLKDFFGFDGVQPDDNLFDDHDLDSMQVVELLAFLEKGFGVVLQPDEMDPALVSTPRQIAELVQKHPSRR